MCETVRSQSLACHKMVTGNQILCLLLVWYAPTQSEEHFLSGVVQLIITWDVANFMWDMALIITARPWVAAELHNKENITELLMI